jgi:hypothetical protein
LVYRHIYLQKNESHFNCQTLNPNQMKTKKFPNQTKSKVACHVETTVEKAKNSQKQIKGLLLLLFFSFSCYINLYSQGWEQKGSTIYGEYSWDEFGWSVSLSADGNTMAASAYNFSGKPTYVRVFTWNGAEWIQKGTDIDGGGKPGYDICLSTDGNILAIGNSKASLVRVYTWNGATWIQKGSDIEGIGDFGYSVYLSSDGNTLAAGCQAWAGYVEVYSWNGSAWTQKGLRIDGEAAEDSFGNSVVLSSDGNCLGVGAIHNDGGGSNSGHVRVYTWNGTEWVQKGNDIDGEAANDRSGDGISMSSDGDIVAIGAGNNTGNGAYAGHVRVYAWNGAEWVQRGNDLDGEAAYDQSGKYISLNSEGDILAIDGQGNDANGSVSGHVRVYSWNGSAWMQLGEDIDGEAAGDAFGKDISLSSDGSIVAIGANGNYVKVYTYIPPCDNTYSELDITACFSYTSPSGNTWTESDIYTDIIPNTAGCDSIITINLTIGDDEDPTIIAPSDITQINDPGLCNAILDLGSPEVGDNCGIDGEPTNNAPALFPEGITTVTWTVTDVYGNINTATQSVEIVNAVPVISPITAPIDPVQVNTLVNVSANFLDNNLQSATWDWGDESTSEGVIGTEITGEHTYSTPGVYTLTLTLTDACGESVSDVFQYIVIYDPDGGFVTGGGWIDSPLGASTQYPDAVGKANFGFVSKYKKGSTVPQGNTEFQFKAGDLNFNSYVYDWLVIAGSKAMFKGEGTINGDGEYGFMISAIDGDRKTNGGDDMFRIKIWELITEDVIYDNQMGDDEDADPTTTIRGGSIVIHDGSDKKSESIDNSRQSLSFIEMYPNPFTNTAYIEVQHDKSIELIINVYDLGGRLIKNLHEGKIKENVRYRFEFTPEAGLASGTFIVKFTMDNNNVITKQLILAK